MFKIIKEQLESIIAVLIAGLETLFIWKMVGTSGNMIIYVFIFVAFLLLTKKTIKIKDKRMWITSAVLALLFTIAQTISTSISIDYTLNHILEKRMLVIIPRLFFISCNGDCITLRLDKQIK